MAPPAGVIMSGLLHLCGLHTVSVGTLQHVLEGEAVEIEVVTAVREHVVSQSPAAGRAAVKAAAGAAPPSTAAHTAPPRSSGGGDAAGSGPTHTALRLVLSEAGLAAGLEALHIRALRAGGAREAAIAVDAQVARHIIELAHHLFAMFAEAPASNIGRGGAAVGMTAVVDVATLSAGLSVLCAGTPEGKVQALFQLFDADGSGNVSYLELYRALGAVFAVVFAVNPTLHAAAGAVSPGQLAAATTLQCFDDCDADGDGFLDFHEFRTWFLSSGLGHTGAVTGLAPAASAASAAGDANRQVAAPRVDAQGVLWFTRFPVTPADAVVSSLLRAAGRRVAKVTLAGQSTHTRVISRLDFLLAMQPFLTTAGLGQDGAEAGVEVLDSLFDLYRFATGRPGASRGGDAGEDEEDDGDGAMAAEARLRDMADANALAVGVSLLCAPAGGAGGTYLDLSFALLDADASGTISLQEAVHYFAAVITLRAAVDPAVAAVFGGDVTPQRMARETAADLFRNADTNHDGVVTKQELHAYLRGAPAELPASARSNGGGAAAAAAVASDADPTTALERFRVATGLAALAPVDVLNVFVHQASPDGFIDTSGFVAGLVQCRTLAGGVGDDRLRTVLPVLVDYFFALSSSRDDDDDEDDVGDEGGGGGGERKDRVEFVELMAGLISVAAGSRADKIDAILTCFDPSGPWVALPLRAMLPSTHTTTTKLSHVQTPTS